MKAFEQTRMRAVQVVIALVAGCGVTAHGQDIILPTHALPPSDIAAELVTYQPRRGLFDIGPFGIIPRIAATTYYDDNASRGADEQEDAHALSFSPGLLAEAEDIGEGVGKAISIDYSTAFLMYLHGGGRDRIKHLFRARGSLLFPKLELGFAQSMEFNTDPDVDVAGRSERTEYNTLLTSRYAVGEKTSVEINLSSELLDYDNNFDSWEIANRNWFNYFYSPKLTLGLGVTLGYLDVEDNPDQTFEQALGRVIYEVAEKLSLNVSFGGELRQYRGGVGDSFSPVWTVAGVYRVREGTAVTLQANQRYRSSAHYGNQDYLRTGLRVGLAQRVYRRVEFTLAGLYYHSDYESTVSGVSSDRTDDSFVLSLGLNTQLWERWTVGVFYDYQDNQSTVPDFDYDRHRVGVRAAWTY